MIVDRASGEFRHAGFGDVVDELEAGDVLVLNRSKVIPARLFLARPSGGRGELLASSLVGERRFRAIGSPLRKFKAGSEFAGADGDFRVRIIERIDDREVLVEAVEPDTTIALLESHGHVPLPPYIDRVDESGDRERYQTVVASEHGSVAAPTAGLHFDGPLLERLGKKGVVVRTIVLHVGLGTFLPLDNDVVEENQLHSEAFAVDAETLAAIRSARASNKRVIAVGTTSTRVLETLGQRGLLDGDDAVTGSTDLFIYPGYEFAVVDGLITNFHLPRSSLLLLVAAFLGREQTLSCYRAAVTGDYRFFSYGDAMLIR